MRFNSMISEKVLFVGSLSGIMQTSWQRMRCLCAMGFDVSTQDTDFFSVDGYRRITRRITGEPFDTKKVAAFNKEILRAVAEIRPKFVWFDKCLLLEADTLIQISKKWPETVTIAHQDDNPFGLRTYENHYWRRFVTAIPFYNVHLVKRDSDIQNFKVRKAQAVVKFVTGFSNELFYFDPPENISNCIVAFVGTQMDDRAEWIRAIDRHEGIPLKVFGNRWNRSLVYYSSKNRFQKAISVEALRRMISGRSIMLNFVSKSNCDEYNGRTFDIPACRGFLLAERTEFHREHFEEGIEAEFFSSVEECISKVLFYSKNESARVKIAKAGHDRCHSSRYDLKSRMLTAFQEISRLRD